jgi:formate dehydrogenase iron-sulfur subunit
VMMTVLTQLSVGTLVTIWLLQLLAVATPPRVAALASLLVAIVALNGATLHLGRPVHAYRALRMWRRSWLSREVLLFTAFAGVASAYAALLWFDRPGATIVGGVTAALGIAAITASGCIYRVPSRPSWNTTLTPMQFGLTAAALGPLLAAALGASPSWWLSAAAALLSGAQLVVMAFAFVRLIASSSLELQGTARLLSTTLRHQFIARGVLLAIGGIVLPLVVTGAAGWWSALAITLAAEMLGRYLFFASAVPRNLTAPYLQVGSEAVCV